MPTTSKKTIQLTSDDWSIFTTALIEKYDLVKDVEDQQIIKNQTSPTHYTPLSEIIREETGVNIKVTWLRDFFTHNFNNEPNKAWKVTFINACCKFIYGDAIKPIELVSLLKERENQLFGSYDIYWSGSTTNIEIVHPISEMSLDFLEKSVSLNVSRNQKTYIGRKPQKHGEKLYIELFNEEFNEKVYFILHIASASENELSYLPGIFASGDRANVVPCSGPLLFVKKSEPNNESKKIVEKYFERYHNNNLIKSWAISDLLEQKYYLINQPNKTFLKNPKTSSLINLQKKLALYFNKKFFLYFWTFNELSQSPSLGRITLKIGDSAEEVSLFSLDSLRYDGYLKLIGSNFIEFSLSTRKTKENSLSIKLKIGLEYISPFSIGVYSVIEDTGSIATGTILMELVNDIENRLTKFEPFSFSYYQPKAKAVNEHIWNYFKEKNLNFIKTPSYGIHDESDFIRFFQSKKDKESQLRNRFMSKIFIATPMSGHVQTFEEIRENVVELRDELINIFNIDVYYAGTNYNPDAGFTYHDIAADVDLKELEESNHFILIYPTKIASSALLELGWALAQKKSCVIFYKSEDDLPFLLKGISSQNVKKIQYIDMPQLLAKVKHIGNKLFPV